MNDFSLTEQHSTCVQWPANSHFMYVNVFCIQMFNRNLFCNLFLNYSVKGKQYLLYTNKMEEQKVTFWTFTLGLNLYKV